MKCNIIECEFCENAPKEKFSLKRIKAFWLKCWKEAGGY